MREGVIYKRLNEVCSSASSNVVINKVANDNGDYPLYGASGVVKNVSFFHRNTTYIGIIKDGAGVGRVNRYPAYSSLVGTLQYIIPNSDVCSIDYLYYVLKHMDLGHSFTGATIPHIYFKDYGKKLIPVPSLDEQQRIVSELDRLASIISDKLQQLRELDNLAQAIFYEMFGDPLTNPKGWEMKKMKEISAVVGGSTPKTEIEENWIGENKWVTPAELKDGVKYITDTDRHISDEAASHLQLMDAGTVLLSTRAPIGKLAITTAPMYCNQGFKNFVLNSCANNEYVYACLKFFVPTLQEMGTGATFKEVSKSKIEVFSIPLPPLNLQQQFAEKVKAIEEQKDVLKQSIAEFENLLAQRMELHFA